MTRCLSNPVVPDNHGPVMQRSAVPENGLYELTADQTIHGNTVKQIFIQQFPVLENYYGAGTFLGQHKDCAGDAHKIELRTVPLASEQASQEPEAIERLPYFRLEDNDQKDEQHRSQFLEDPTGHEKPQIFGDDIQKHKKAQSHYDLKGLGVLEPAVQL